MASIRYSFALAMEIPTHVEIARYIERNCSRDTRGLRLQPFMERLLFECARNDLSLEEVCEAIRLHGERTGRKGAESEHRSKEDSAVQTHNERKSGAEGPSETGVRPAHEDPTQGAHELHIDKPKTPQEKPPKQVANGDPGGAKKRVPGGLFSGIVGSSKEP